MGATLAIGTPVVHCADGAKLGTIARLYLDPRRNKVVGFAVRCRRRLLRSFEAVVDLGDVESVGPDGVALAATAELHSLQTTERRRRELVDLGGLLGRPVVTASGIDVGRVVAVGIDPTTRRLARLDVAAPGHAVPGLVWGDEVLRCKRDRVVVADAVLAPAPAIAQRVPATTVHRFGEPDRRRVVRYEGRRRFLASA